MEMALCCIDGLQFFCKYWYWFMAAIVTMLMVPLIVWLAIFYNQQHSHYHSLDCNISNCIILDVKNCTYFRFRYACYDGSFDYSAAIDNVTYTDPYNFSARSSGNIEIHQKCISNGTITCTYDDRNIRGTLSLDDQPDWFGLIVVCFVAAAIVFFAIMGAIFTHTHRKRRDYDSLASSASLSNEQTRLTAEPASKVVTYTRLIIRPAEMST